MPVRSMCGGEPQSRWQQGNKFGAATGIVLERVQPVDGGRWGRTWFISLPGFAFSQMGLFPALLSLTIPSYYYTLISFFPSLLILSSFPPFVSTHTLSELLDVAHPASASL